MNTIPKAAQPRFPEVGEESLLAIQAAVREALAEHGRAGRPVVVGRHGEVVLVHVNENGDVIGNAE